MRETELSVSGDPEPPCPLARALPLNGVEWSLQGPV